METGILLESGTNELEILEFCIGNNSYGINVAKVKEILTYAKPTPVPNADPCIEGIFMPRDEIITLINLPKKLGFEQPIGNSDMNIVTNFNKLHVAFHVNSVVGIHRVSWKDIIKPDATICGAAHGVSTGIIKLNEKLIIILDFEKIVTDISPETGLKTTDIDHLGNRVRNSIPILLAEDSNLLNHLIMDCLRRAGYVNVLTTENGQEAWDLLTKFKEEKTLEQKVRLVITDIEMPLMDGHRLTKLIRSDDAFANIPVVIFSSLINDEMRRKGESLGAAAQLTKPEIGSLVEALDRILGIHYPEQA